MRMVSLWMLTVEVYVIAYPSASLIASPPLQSGRSRRASLRASGTMSMPHRADAAPAASVVNITVHPALIVPVLEMADLDHLVTYAEAFSISDIYGSTVWPSGLIAARILYQMGRGRAGGLHGLRVLELGSGTGIASLAAMRMGADAMATDIFPPGLDLIRRAAELQPTHEGQGTLDVMLFDVTASYPLPDADVLVAADVLYDQKVARHVGRRVAEALSKRMRVIVTDPGRAGRADMFAGALQECGRLPDATVREMLESGRFVDAQVDVASSRPVGSDGAELLKAREEQRTENVGALELAGDLMRCDGSLGLPLLPKSERELLHFLELHDE
ncbi:unnamed protein product [Vitrella brassicaformis CCMP3155]|uniref:Methyltransferase domain-containing protein n=1 Tax=Vitrella brassicaformis (strain CCMP3155) TaxID=1169540 RepID=A0A0G4EA24_VITBC|nr:unnamed protein product [Vitrella brassicaformis CCMP3155]|eukprot:CEL92792.1 unnamed protein product [Vitrella brassicaformis CCMP3155]